MSYHFLNMIHRLNDSDGSFNSWQRLTTCKCKIRATKLFTRPQWGFYPFSKLYFFEFFSCLHSSRPEPCNIFIGPLLTHNVHVKNECRSEVLLNNTFHIRLLPWVAWWPWWSLSLLEGLPSCLCPHPQIWNNLWWNVNTSITILFYFWGKGIYFTSRKGEKETVSLDCPWFKVLVSFQSMKWKECLVLLSLRPPSLCSKS